MSKLINIYKLIDTLNVCVFFICKNINQH